MEQVVAANRRTVRDRLNAPFWLAFAIVVVGYAVAFYVLRFLLPQAEIAGTLAALVLGGGAYVQRSIEQRWRTSRGPVVPLSGYQRPWYLLGAVGLVAVWLAASLVPGAQLCLGPVTAVASNLDTLIRLVPPAVAFAFGVVAGQRADRYGLLVVVFAVVGGYLLAQLTQSLVITLATSPGVCGNPMVDPGVGPPIGVPPGFELPPDPRPIYLADNIVALFLDNPLVLLMPAAMLGLWRGTSGRLGAYVGSLLREVTPGDRQAIVDLAYETAASGQRSAKERVGEVAAGEPGDRQ
ncbi:MAG TPA: hypothetical protein VMZ33_05775 [Candidatus Limnocylindrales bacterium]|nr:hypothetical protein [Candidatus Limnocylindrales bacterium]